MDPQHRDRIAFVRICSGQFQRGMQVRHNRLRKSMTLSKAITFMARDRAGADDAWPGDIIGVHNHGTLKIGDTLSSKEELKILGIPNFAPEHFQRVILQDPFKSKQLDKGLRQLTEEGAIQLFRPVHGTEYILGAVGALQFDITAARLAAEYGVQASYEPMNVYAVRWIDSRDRKALEAFESSNRNALVEDAQGHRAVLFSSGWRLDKAAEDWPQITFSQIREAE
jgi:peptide chain release factor 3